MKHFLYLVVLLTFAGVASGGAILTIGNSSDNEAVGNMVEVDLTVFGLPTTLDSYQFDVDFTPGVLWAMGTSSGTIDNVDGTITGIARHNVGLNFGGTLFKLYFMAAGPGTAFLSIPASSVSLWDANGNLIPVTGVDGRVYVDGPTVYSRVVPEPGSLGLLLIGMGAMGVWSFKQRRRC